MLPQFFEMLGLHTQGLTFERIFWALVVCAGIIVLTRELLARRPLEDAWYGWAIGLALLGYGAYQLVLVLFYRQLYFGAEGLRLSNYGLAIALAFVFAIWVGVREARRSPSPPDAGHFFDLAFWILIFSMVGARLLFIVVEWRDYVNLCVAPELVPGSGGESDCFAVLKFWKGGLVFFGGFLGAVAASAWYCRKHRISFMRTADVAIPSVALGHFFGRLGCLSAGCCYGRVCDAPWGVAFPEGSTPFVDHYRALSTTDPSAALDLLEQGHSLHLHPTQLYEASGELAFFAFLVFYRPHKRFHGELLALWLMLYSVLRFVVELYRGDAIRGFLFEIVIAPLNTLLGIGADEPTILSTSQTISLALFAAGALVWVTQRRRSEGRPAE
jgi:phosphatidylglycerol---prolipoprotein diacylglyceryl transferase